MARVHMTTNFPELWRSTMCPLPADPEARRRLLDAQRAESDALKAVELAARVRGRVQKKLDAAQADLDAAKVALVECSGVERSALLLAEAESSLRRLRRTGVGNTMGSTHSGAIQSRHE